VAAPVEGEINMRKMTAGELKHAVRLLLTGRDFLSRVPYLSVDETKSKQFSQLQELVTSAYQTVPFYRSLYDDVGFEPGDLTTWSAFEQLPLVSKDQVIEAYPQSFVSSDFRLEDLIVSGSSGSGGKPLDVAYPSRTFLMYALATLRLYQMGFHYRPWHRHVYIYTSPYPFTSIFGMYPLHFISTLAPIDDVEKQLLSVKPDLLVCYPSHLRQITEMCSSSVLSEVRPKLISVSSEMSSQSERDGLEEMFGCPVLDNYSSEELARIASQCLSHKYHVFEDMNYIEVLDSQDQPTNELGAVVGTNLHNFATPLIRYRQNDFAQVGPSTCSCGRTHRELSSLQGRQNDSFVLPSGRMLTSGFLLDATYEFLLQYRGAIRDFCLIQESSAEILLEVVAGPKWSDSTRVAISKRFAEFLEVGVRFRIDLVEECEKTRTGKRNPIICRAAPIDS
jgi:phenylacetate-CoA ligase